MQDEKKIFPIKNIIHSVFSLQSIFLVEVYFFIFLLLCLIFCHLNLPKIFVFNKMLWGNLTSNLHLRHYFEWTCSFTWNPNYGRVVWDIQYDGWWEKLERTTSQPEFEDQPWSSPTHYHSATLLERLLIYKLYLDKKYIYLRSDFFTRLLSAMQKSSKTFFIWPLI